MRFCPDNEHENRFYVDREVDDKADYFEACSDCASRLNPIAGTGENWFRETLCGECYTAVEVISDIADAMNKRPTIMEPVREPMIWPSDKPFPKTYEHEPDADMASAFEFTPGFL